MTSRVLDHAGWRIEARPTLGGRLARLMHEGVDLLVPIDTAIFDPEHWPKAGAYPLIPFHNRVPGGRFTWRGRAAVLPVHPASAPNALHGHASRMPWSCARHDDRLEMALTSEAAAHWPWRFSAAQAFCCRPNQLEITMTIRNLDTAPMPAGLGWHPYFPANMTLSDDAQRGWDVGPDTLPRGDLRPAAELTGETRYLKDWEAVEMHVPGGGVYRMTAVPVLGHLVMFAPRGAGFACAEPVSHPVAALAYGPGGGMQELAPGASLTATIRIAATARYSI